MEFVKPIYDDKDPAHRFDHTDRLYDFCMVVGKALRAEMDSLIPAPIIHGLKKGHEERPWDTLGAVGLARAFTKDGH